MRGNGKSTYYRNPYVGEWTKKGEKKSFHLFCFEKGEIGGLTFFFTFFSIVEFFGNTQKIARKYKTYIRRFGEERGKKKVTCNHRPYYYLLSIINIRARA